MKNKLRPKLSMGLWATRAVVWAWVGAMGPLVAQEAAEEEVFELSPFQVSATDEVGYAARATSGGTRVRTDLRDIGSQVDVMSVEFMEDIGAVEPDEAFLYSINTENEQENPNYADADGNANNFERRAPGVTARGFGGAGGSGATKARNFFPTNLSLHGYNTGSVVVASGPNAILFGLGKPGGVVNTSLNAAMVERDLGSFQIRVDNWGERILMADYNRVILPDQLALRFAVLKEDSEQFHEPNFKDQDRYYGAVTWRLLPNLTVRVHYEDISITETPEQWLLPNDDVSAYLLRGETDSSFHQRRPVFHFGDDTELDAIWPDYTSQTVGEEWVNSEIGQPGSELDPGLDRFKYTITPELMEANGWRYDRINLWGKTQTRLSDADIVTALVEWNPLKGLFLELGYNRETFTGRQVAYGRSARYRMMIDTALTLPDGSPNPYFEQFFVGDTPWGYESYNEEEAFRLTAAYELDLADRLAGSRGWLRHFLGRHQLAGLLSSRESKDIRQLSWRTWKDVEGQLGVPPPFITDSGAFGDTDPDSNYLRNNVRGVSLVQTIDPAGSRPYMQLIPGWDPASDEWLFEYEGETYTASQFDAEVGGFRPAESSLLEIESLMLAWQGKFWEDRLVLTYGYRRDKVENFRFKRSDSLDLGEDDIAVDDRIQGGNSVWYSELEFSNIPDLSETYSNQTKGVVFHPVGLVGNCLNWLSIFYNESSNSDAGQTSFGPTGRPNATQTGNGRDYGFMLNSPDGRFGLRVNWFETALQNEETGAFALVGRIYNLEQRLEEVDPLGFRPAEDGFDVRITGRNQLSALQDSESDGMELTFVASPSRQWNIRLTVARLEKVQTDIAGEWVSWLEDRIAYYEQAPWFDPNNPDRPVTSWDRQAGDITIGDPGQAPVRGWGNIAYRDGQYDANDESVREYYEQQILGDSLALIQASDGLQDTNVRKWRANLTVTYRFTEGLLERLKVGGSIRYRDKAAIGFPLVEVGSSETLLPDVSQPYFGDSELFFDALLSYDLKKSLFGADYRFQLNVRNLADNAGPYVRRSDSQGTPRVYGFYEPRTFIFSVTASF